MGKAIRALPKNVTIQLSDRYANIIVVRIEGMFEWAQAIRASLRSFHGNQIDPFQPAQKYIHNADAQIYNNTKIAIHKIDPFQPAQKYTHNAHELKYTI